MVYSKVIHEDIDHLIDYLRHHEGEKVDMHILFHAFTLDSFAKIGFGKDLKCLENPDSPYPFATAFDSLVSIIIKNLVNPIYKITNWFDGTQKIMEDNLKLINDLAYETIKSRRKEMELNNEKENSESKRPKDLLDLFMESEYTSASGMSDEQLRNMILNMILAGNILFISICFSKINYYIIGRDTTAQSLSWTFFALSSRPDVIAKIRQEFQTVRNGVIPTFNEVSPLKYTTAVVYEALRLYPSVPVDVKTSIKEVRVLLSRNNMTTTCSISISNVGHLAWRYIHSSRHRHQLVHLFHGPKH
jgi:cytochrome P450